MSVRLYFYNHDKRKNDKDIITKTNLKSGKIAENYIRHFINNHFENKYIKEQVKYNNFKFDFASKHIIYEVKNYMYDSNGTADEKILYSCYKYYTCLNKYDNIYIILCSKFENIFIEKYLFMFYELGFYLI